MKGIELPINVMIIVVIAVVVLLGVMALFNTGWGSGSSIISIESQKNSYCQVLDARDCNNPTQEMTDFCSEYYGGQSCAEVCGCDSSGNINQPKPSSSLPPPLIPRTINV